MGLFEDGSLNSNRHHWWHVAIFSRVCHKHVTWRLEGISKKNKHSTPIPLIPSYLHGKCIESGCANAIFGVPECVLKGEMGMVCYGILADWQYGFVMVCLKIDYPKIQWRIMKLYITMGNYIPFSDKTHWWVDRFSTRKIRFWPRNIRILGRCNKDFTSRNIVQGRIGIYIPLFKYARAIFMNTFLKSHDYLCISIILWVIEVSVKSWR